MKPTDPVPEPSWRPGLARREVRNIRNETAKGSTEMAPYKLRSMTRLPYHPHGIRVGA